MKKERQNGISIISSPLKLPLTYKWLNTRNKQAAHAGKDFPLLTFSSMSKQNNNKIQTIIKYLLDVIIRLRETLAPVSGLFIA